MQAASQSRIWNADDFDRVLRETERLSGQAHILWKDALSADETRVKAWAFGLNQSSSELQPEELPFSKRNPPWSRDELILALELYLRHRASPLRKDDREVTELSEFLGKMGQVLGLAEAETYRNANGVYMKMMNFRRFDTEYTNDGKVGLTRGNKDEEVVWHEFSIDPVRLAAVTAAIRLTIEKHSGGYELRSTDEPDIQEAEEGHVLTRLHRVRERNRKLIEAKKKAALKQHGRLSCEACSFDFSQKYGPAGEGLIDVHHTIPVHTLSQGDITRLEDLALLCANCHRVVHSSRRWLTVKQVMDLIRR
ncbi:MAG: HNH endonuclease [Nitrosospira sp.]|nr:HNH endonuclease [Nitrosospira sp.]